MVLLVRLSALWKNYVDSMSIRVAKHLEENDVVTLEKLELGNPFVLNNAGTFK
jgi:hypothetical protein